MDKATALDIALRALEIFSVSYGSIWFAKRQERRELARRAKEEADRNQNMDRDYVRKQQLMPMMEELRRTLGGQRCLIIGFSNGDTCFSGYHMKKLSITLETCEEGVLPVAPHFQLVPTKKFERNLDKLYESESDMAVFHEEERMDELGIMNRSFGLITMASANIRDEYGRWVGIVVVSYGKSVHLTLEELSRIKLVADRIGVTLKA